MQKRVGDHAKQRTFVLKKVAHARASSEHELRDILDDLGLVLGREGGEPFRQALRMSAQCREMTMRRLLKRDGKDLRLCLGGKGG